MLEGGASASDALLTVHALRGGGPEPRLGLAVGRSVGGSVERNRVKRLLREAFRLHRAELPPGHDLVVVPKDPEAARRPLEAFVRSLVDTAARAAERHRARGARQGRGPREGRGPRGGRGAPKP